MKRLYLSLISLLVCLMASADRVTEQQAYEKAQLFMQGKQIVTTARARGRSGSVATENGYYIFNVQNRGGFVVIASDDRMPEILGYSDKGELNPATAPCNVKWLLNYYDEVAKHLEEQPLRARAGKRTAKAAVRPLVTTLWDQGAPYNDLCPEYNGGRCVAGCVATAMAQVINYNRWPLGQTGAVAAYVTGTNQISVPALEPTHFDWDNMTNDDIARLMRYCGQSVQMDYGLNESGATPMNEPRALTSVFKYSQTAHCVNHESYSDEDWEDLLYNELAEQRPIVYNGWGTGGGHTFVVHGYADGRFYINWGWSGSEDGYFYLTGLNTGIDDFNDTQSATIGIQPPGGTDANRPKVVVKDIGFSGSEKYFYRQENGSFQEVHVYGSLVNELAETKTFYVGLGLYDENGLQKVLWEEEHVFPGGDDYRFYSRFAIGSDVADGTYRIVPISRGSQSEEWQSDANSSEHYLSLTIKGKYMMVMTYPFSTEEPDTIDMGIHTIGGITYNLYTYQGSPRAYVLPCENGSYSGDVYIPDNVEFEGTAYHCYKADRYAFSNNKDLTSLSTAMHIGPAIYNCPNLERVELREGVRRLNLDFCDLPKLESITFPSTLTFTPQGGILACQNLKSIHYKAAQGMIMSASPQWDIALPCLKDIHFQSSEPPQFQAQVVNVPVNPQVTIHVPRYAKQAYQHAGWEGWNIVEDQVIDFRGIEWGYNTHNTIDGGQCNSNWGENDTEYAIRIPAEQLTHYRDGRITTIKFYSPDVVPVWGDIAKYEYVFITCSGKDYLLKQFIETESGWNMIILDEPLTITGEDLFVGIGRNNDISTKLSNADSPSPDGFYIRIMGSGVGINPEILGKFLDFSDESSGPLPIRIVIESDQYPTDLVLDDVTVSLTETPIQLKGRVTNRTDKEVRKYIIRYSVDSQADHDCTIETSLMPGMSEFVSIDLPAMSGRNHSITYSITDIDGQTDQIASNSSGTIFFALPATTYFPRRLVMEEATGTWCGWCVRGIEVIERLTKQFPENFIAIGLHNNDEMDKIENYGAITSKLDKYPSWLINRTNTSNPNYPKIVSLIEEMKDKAEAKVTATAVYTKRDSSEVTVTTESVFGFNDDKTSNFRLAYVVVEDHVGPYVQNNYYSGMTPAEGEDYMQGWKEKDAKVKIEFNDVGRGLYGGVNGVEGSLPNVIKEGETYKYSYSFSLPQNIENKKNIRIVVMMIDNVTGEIVNAAQTKVLRDGQLDNETFEFQYGGESVPNGGVVTIDAEKDSWGSNELNCETNPTNDPWKGLILASSDGSVRSGSATLEILNNTLGARNIQWCMGGTCELMNDKSSLQKTFSLNDDGKVQVQFDATGIRQEGLLEARLSATIDGQTQTVNIKFVNDGAAGVGSILQDCQRMDVYDMKGRKVREGATSLEGLPHGVYVVNGKKVVR